MCIYVRRLNYDEINQKLIWQATKHKLVNFRRLRQLQAEEVKLTQHVLLFLSKYRLFHPWDPDWPSRTTSRLTMIHTSLLAFSCQPFILFKRETTTFLCFHSLTDLHIRVLILHVSPLLHRCKSYAFPLTDQFWFHYKIHMLIFN